MSAGNPLDQLEINTARIVVQNQQILKQLERLLEVMGDQPDYSLDEPMTVARLALRDNGKAP